VKNVEDNRVAHKLDLNKIKSFFSTRGYHTEKLEQVWRHVTGILSKRGHRYFVKLASTQEVAKRTRNEFAWNDLVNSLRGKNRLPVSVPKNLESGEYMKLFWYISDYAGEQPLATREDKNTRELETQIPLIAKTAKSIIDMRTKKLLPIDKKLSKRQVDELLLKRLNVWNKATKIDLSNLIGFIQKRLKSAKLAPLHGDLVPWHFIKNENSRLYLVDAEHAHILGIKFYDVAYFYHRVYTKLKRPDIANRFLEEYKSEYNLKNNDEQCLSLIIAYRIAGGYMDAQEDTVTSIKLQKELEEMLLTGRL
jgi:thiamine kinase-like enzyme